MADKLTLHGAKDIKARTGTTLTRLNPKRGGDTHLVKQWWNKNAKSTIYVDCAVILVNRTAGKVKLAIPITESTRLTISYDGTDDFTFSGILNVDRIGVFDENLTFIEEYRLPHIVGGKQMKVTPAGNTLPGTGGVTGSPITGTITKTPSTTNDDTAEITFAGGPAIAAQTVTWSFDNDGTGDDVQNPVSISIGMTATQVATALAAAKTDPDVVATATGTLVELKPPTGDHFRSVNLTVS